MKNLILTACAFFAFGYASAQVDPKTAPVEIPADSTTTIKKTDKTTIKNSETVKTKDHDKSARKAKTTSKDTTMIKNRKNP